MASATLIRNLDELTSWTRAGGALSVGNFDGVHRGHARIVGRLIELARAANGPVIIFSFAPHPIRLLRPESAPTPLVWLERKAELLGQLGVDALVAYPTDPQILALTPEDFFAQIIVQRLAPRAMVEGPNFRFGRDRAGTVRLLTRLCQSAAINLDIVEPLLVDGQYVSSSRIRKLLGAGHIHAANQLLTAPHRIRGNVGVGVRRGRTLGFPTANLEVRGLLVPPAGVYAGRAITGDSVYAAAIHVGPNPTFHDATSKIEAHLLDFDDNLYGTPLEIEFLGRLRDVQPFHDRAALVRQLHKDIATVRRLLSGNPTSSRL